MFGFLTFVFAEKFPENILKNGDFDDKLDNWHHWTHASANAAFLTEGKKAEPNIGENAAYISIAKGGDNVGHNSTLSATIFLGERHHLYLWFVGKK